MPMDVNDDTWTEPFDWQQHSSLLERVIAFLDAHALVPDHLNIRGDGWAEAQFTYAVGKDDLAHIWYTLQKQNKVDLRQPMLQLDGIEYNMLRVRFLVRPPITKWQCLKQFVS